MILTERILGKTHGDKRRVIESLENKDVIILDAHLEWQHGKIKNAVGSMNRYTLEFYNAREPLSLSYDDLEKVLEITPYVPKL